MRHWPVLIGACALTAALVNAQEFPKGSPEGAKLLAKAITAGLDAGALEMVKQPKSGPTYFKVLNAAKWQKALAGRKDLLTPVLRDTLVGHWPDCDDVELPFLFALLQIIGEEAQDKRALAFLGYFQAAAVLQQRPGQALKHFTAAAQLFEAVGDPGWEIECLLQMGLVHYYQHEPKAAAQAWTTALTKAEKTYGQNHVRVATCLHNLGAVFGDLGEHGKALEYLLQAAGILEKLGTDPKGLAAVYNSLGGHYHLQANHAAALKYYEKGLKLRQQEFGPNDPEVAKNLDNLADVFMDVGEFLKALDYYEKARGIFVKKHGERHPDSAINQYLLAKAQAELGNLDEALESSRKALDFVQSYFGRFHGHTAAILSNLSSIYAQRGEYALALERAEDALEIRVKLDGPRGRGNVPTGPWTQAPRGGRQSQ
jgi:tetratricopeptide (TPR) repeat protein